MTVVEQPRVMDVRDLRVLVTAGGGGIGPAGLWLIAQGHEFIDLGDDAVLFGEGREGIPRYTVSTAGGFE